MEPYNGLSAIYFIPIIAGIIIAVISVFLAYRMENKDNGGKMKYFFMLLFVLSSLGVIIWGTSMNTISLKNYHSSVVSNIENNGLSIVEGFESATQIIDEENTAKFVVETPSQGLIRCRGMVESETVKFLCQDENREFTIPMSSLG